MKTSDWISIKDQPIPAAESLNPSQPVVVVVKWEKTGAKETYLALDRDEDIIFYTNGCVPIKFITHWYPITLPEVKDE